MSTKDFILGVNCDRPFELTTTPP